jgi:YidC/Oxa1 family membrane protein insertase
MPNHRTSYEVLPGPRELAAGAERSSSSSQRRAPTATRSCETLTFRRGSYLIDVAYEVTNEAPRPISPTRTSS